ncbi:MAG TPA: YggS family pyridoxal phosphate-dependent enzyme [Candidatus Omnitrophota bacterium]|nr:YggS family pyridoxal phosphate-dependent enzyme [Candidatus Omnitrophota bacterium]
MIRDNIAQIFSRIEAVCRKSGRDPKEIAFVGITKYADISQIKEAVAAGLTHIGENKVQDAKRKFSALEGFPAGVMKHMVGHLQTNKVKQAVEIFDCIQSVDSLKLAETIAEQAAKLNKTIDLLVQVNTAAEDQKFGIAPDETSSLIEQIVPLKNIRLCGLMAIAPLTEDRAIVRKCFRDLRVLREGISEKFSQDGRVAMKYLSMGMTDDYEIALEEGSNMTRIGRAIFRDQEE